MTRAGERAGPMARRCPVCGKPTATETRPFCSRRCADIDLHRWLTGAYVIRGRDDETAATTRSDQDEDEG
jgi:endogenous inhibitor of DNA gyrase (YacG/DUF329 family)